MEKFYLYKATDSNGELIDGSITASSENEVKSYLSKKGYKDIDITLAKNL